MDYLLKALDEALRLILERDPEVMTVMTLSLKLTLISVLTAALPALALGGTLASFNFPGRRLAIVLLNTLLGLPTVVAGLFVYSFISRRGPLGEFGLLFTPTAVVIGQVIICFPLMTALFMNSLSGTERRLTCTALSLGASRIQTFILVLKETRFALMGVVAAGFGRVIAEVGAAMMLGGNIRGFTRTLTTAIALETGKGDFGFALALGLILLFVSFCVNLAIHFLQGGESVK